MRRVSLSKSSGHRPSSSYNPCRAANQPGGTSTGVFSNFPVNIAGKTGTAEKGAGRADQSWYAALAPYPNPRYVVITTFEAGGFCAETAAPASCKILAVLLNVKKKGACAPKATPTAGTPAE